MRYVKSTNTYKASNFEMNMDNLEARSYSWWLFTRMHDGKLVFNGTNYSISTTKHQNKALKLLNYHYDLRLEFTRKSLSEIKEALQDEIRLTNIKINELLTLVERKGTRKETNHRRLLEVDRLNSHIKNIVENYL